MNKNELIEQIAVSADITKAKAGLCLLYTSDAADE